MTALLQPLLADGEPDWAHALCTQTDPDAFFPEKGQNPNRAKKVCARCPIRTGCLTYALDNDIRFGVWGGTSENERRALRRVS